MRRSGYSIRQQITTIFVLLLSGAVLLCFLINNFFLESYYVSNKEKSLMVAYDAINKASINDTINSDEFDVELHKLCGKYNLSVIVLDSESKTVICSTSDSEMLSRMLLENLFQPLFIVPGFYKDFDQDSSKSKDPDTESETSGDVETEEYKENQSGFIPLEESDSMTIVSVSSESQESKPEPGKDDENRSQGPAPRGQKQREILEEEDNYTIERVTDVMTSTDYLEMWGILDDGCLFMVRSPIEAIRDSVDIANRFLLYAGLISAFLGALIVYIVSARITKPIHHLADISERMIHMDFDEKFEDKSSREIVHLGENINSLSETLEKTISELKTANNELLRDIQQKEEIDQMRQEFLSNVSHELKTPIALIQGYAEGLKEGINDDDASSRNFYCEVIMDEASKMNIMVKKLLTLNQLEFGVNQISMERFDVVSLIRTYIQNAEILTRQEGIEVKMQPYDPIYVWADEFMTEEVFMNYFSNAMHHCSKDKVIEVKLIKKKECVRISVFNTGEPIPEDSLEHVWEKFYKVDKARTREYGGSGVGLSIVKAIMKSFNQEYGVINYDNGVEFWFELDTTGADSCDGQ